MEPVGWDLAAQNSNARLLKAGGELK